MIPVTDHLSIDESELSFSFVLASGPGGQNVNRVATAVQLRFNIGDSPSLPEPVKQRLRTLAGGRMTQNDELLIEAKRFRTQPQNRRDAVERLVNLVRRATEKPKKRRPTKPSKAARQRRLDGKKKQSEKKRRRKDDW